MSSMCPGAAAGADLSLTLNSEVTDGLDPTAAVNRAPPSHWDGDGQILKRKTGDMDQNGGCWSHEMMWLPSLEGHLFLHLAVQS